MASTLQNVTQPWGKLWKTYDTSACLTGSASLHRAYFPSWEFPTFLALTRAWTRTRACMHLRVTAACFLTCQPRNIACNLTTAFRALKARLACKSITKVQKKQINGEKTWQKMCKHNNTRDILLSILIGNPHHNRMNDQKSGRSFCNQPPSTQG